MIFNARHQAALAAVAALLLAIGAFRWWTQPVLGPEAGQPGDRAGEFALKLNPNTATQDELEAVPGMGRSRAATIVEARAQGTTFATLTDLDALPGFGPAAIEQIGQHLVFSP